MLIAANKNYLRARRISQQGGGGTVDYSHAALFTCRAKHKKKIRKNQLKIEN